MYAIIPLGLPWIHLVVYSKCQQLLAKENTSELGSDIMKHSTFIEDINLIRSEFKAPKKL